VVAGAIGLTIIHFLGQAAGSPEGIVASLALAAPFYGAGVIGLLGVACDRAGYCCASALALVPMSLISIATIPLVFAAMILMTYGARCASRSGQRLIADAPLAGPLVVALFLILLHEDPAEWRTANGGGSSSNIVTNVEALCSFVLVGAAVLVAWRGVRRPLRPSSRG
jgi:hypothetical protein